MLTYTLEKREKESLYEQLYRFIRGDILSGRLQAGEKLPQPASVSHALTAVARSASNAFLRSRQALSPS